MASRVYEIVEGGRYGLRRGHVFDAFLGTTTLVAITETALLTEPTLAAYHGLLRIIDWVCVTIFAIEYVLRVAVCHEDRRGRHRGGLRGRLRYMMTPLALVDLFSFAPMLVSLVFPFETNEFTVLRLIRLLTLLRYFSAFETLATVISNERKPMLASGILMLILLMITATFGYLVERAAQPEAFASIPRAMWWAIVTLATIGYGDVVPQTVAGKMLGAVTALLGLGMFALPAGIIASGFAEEMRRRNFMVTWGLVAKVPFFDHLPASRIAEIAGLLEPRSASRGEAIVIKGERADGMYFLIEGEVDVMIADPPIRMRDGDFFGEMALLSSQRRSATVVARSFTRLLKLRIDHFHTLIENHPDLAVAMRQVSDERARQRGERDQEQSG
jgi:voltage-gated potassium channel